MLATSKNVLFPGHNHLLTTGTDGMALIIARVPARVIIKVNCQQYRLLAGSYDLKISYLEVASMAVSWWIVAFSAVLSI